MVYGFLIIKIQSALPLSKYCTFLKYFFLEAVWSECTQVNTTSGIAKLKANSSAEHVVVYRNECICINLSHFSCSNADPSDASFRGFHCFTVYRVIVWGGQASGENPWNAINCDPFNI